MHEPSGGSTFQGTLLGGGVHQCLVASPFGIGGGMAGLNWAEEERIGLGGGQRWQQPLPLKPVLLLDLKTASLILQFPNNGCKALGDPLLEVALNLG